MSEALIASLQKRVDDLTQENAGLKAEAKDRRIAGKRLKEEVEALKSERDTLKTERDSYKSKLDAAPGEKDAEIDRLNGEIKARDLRDAFNAVAGKFELKQEVERDGKKEAQTLKVRPDAASTLLEKLGLKPDEKGNLPTEDQITEALKGAATAHPWGFTQGETPNAAPGGATQPLQTRAQGPGPGATRSGVDHNPKVTTTDVVNQRFAQWGGGVDGRF